MADCTTLEALASKFQGKVTAIDQCLQLRGSLHQPTTQALLKGVQVAMADLDTVLAEMKAEIKQQKQALKEVEKLKQQWCVITAQMNYMQHNLPARLPRHTALDSAPTNQKVPGDKTPPRQHKAMALMTPMSTLSTGSSPHAPSFEQIRKKSPALFLPELDYLTVEEFATVPKYMKGRLNYEQANVAIDAYNKAIAGKYKLMATAKSKLSDKIRQKIRTYKQQETKDTEGYFFISDADIREFSSMKLDKTARTLMTIFRHCGRLREVRGGGTTRYVVCA